MRICAFKIDIKRCTPSRLTEIKQFCKEIVKLFTLRFANLLEAWYTKRFVEITAEAGSTKLSQVEKIQMTTQHF